MIFWVTLLVMIVVMIWLVADTSERTDELFLEVFAIMALIVILAFLTARRVGLQQELLRSYSAWLGSS